MGSIRDSILAFFSLDPGACVGAISADYAGVRCQRSYSGVGPGPLVDEALI